MVPNFGLLIFVMPLTPQSEDRIYNLACECEELFEKHLSQGHSPLVASLLAEYQQRFSLWTAYLGVFARPIESSSAAATHDTEIKLQDIEETLKSGVEKTQDTEETLESDVGSLTEIEETLDRLNRLGVAIRQSARLNLNYRVKLFAQNVNVKDFEHLFTTMVQVLYPNAHPSLRSRLARSMTDRLARIVFLKSRQLALATRRDGQPQQMADIPEDETVQGEAAPTEHISHFPHHPPSIHISQDSLPHLIGDMWIVTWNPTYVFQKGVLSLLQDSQPLRTGLITCKLMVGGGIKILQGAKIMTRHIASHLQALMALTIRIASRQTDQSVAMEISSDVVDSDDAFSSSRDEDLPPLGISNDPTSVEPDPLTSPTISSYQDDSTIRSNDDGLQQIIPPESEDLGKWGDVPRQGEVLAELEVPVLDILTVDTGDTNEETAMGSDTDSTDEKTVDNDELSNQGIPIRDNRQRNVDGTLFQRASLVRSPTLRGSLLTLMMEQNKRLQSPGDRASQSTLAIPQLQTASTGLSLQGSLIVSDEAPFAMEGSINTTLATEGSISTTPTLPQEIPIVGNAGDTQDQAALSPRTTRRRMLETELTESLRRHLLWERQQRPTNVILKDSNTSDHVPEHNSRHDPDQLTEEPLPDMQDDFTFSNDDWTYF
ncbi:hypothetical protein THAR02_02487 [Trichoderma harzianum]|uniref:DUF3295 domain-containing protein n=1 Tax=Trichoderma harzianum TaxID=5544 RepID=A0A0F9ZZG6_TRIHA|nr:hypothetical protein THAR02_02487 [Trichoderma harzianum]